MRLNPFRSLFGNSKPSLSGNKSAGSGDDLFTRKLMAGLSPAATVNRGPVLATPAGGIPVDLLVEADGRRIVVDYKNPDTFNETLDEWRDALILGNGLADSVYRFAGMDMEQFRDDCLFFMAASYPQIFRSGFKGRSSGLKFDGGERNVVFYNMVGDDEVVYKLKFILEHRRKSDQQGRWNQLFQKAIQNPGRSLAELIQL